MSKRCVLSTLTWNDRQVLSLEGECEFEIAVSHQTQAKGCMLLSYIQLLTKFATAELTGDLVL